MNRRPACFQEGFKTRKTPLNSPLNGVFLRQKPLGAKGCSKDIQGVAIERRGGALSQKKP